jgi:hypothetical protein
MQPDLPEPRQQPGRSPFDDLRERLARLPASHPSAPGYRDWPEEPAGPADQAGDGSLADDGPPPGGDSPDSGERPDPVAAAADTATPEVAEPGDTGPDDAEPGDAGEPDGTEGDSEPDRGAATQRPGRGGRAGGTAVGYLLVDGGDGPYRPWFTGEPPRPWFSDDPPGRSG